MEGKLIVIEGSCDGVGKSTQLLLLMKEDGFNVYSHHFPTYGSYQANAVERYLNGEYGEIKNLSPYFINSLYAEDRIITWKSELSKEYENGSIIVCDRYTTSSLIYQATNFKTQEEKKNFIDYVCDFEYNKLGLKKPDMVIFLKTNFDVSMKLRNNRVGNEGVTNDIHERDTEFLRKVYDTSLMVSKYLNWYTVECSDDEKMYSIDEIHDKIYTYVKKRI